jgi:predicted phosphodiesterase
VVTILHVSDTHFHYREGTTGLPENLGLLVGGQIRWGGLDFVSSHSLTVADAVAYFAYVNRDAIDVIVVSGDLATTGDRRDLLIAREFIDGVPAPGRGYWTERFPTLRAAGKPVVVIPGNHDRFGPVWSSPRWNWPSWRDWSVVKVDRPYESGATIFDDVFGDFWRAGRGVQELWRDAAEQPSVVLLAADFTLPARDAADQAPFGYLGRGRIAQEQIDALVDQTNHVREESPGCAVFWVIHFKPGLAADNVLLLCDDDLLGLKAAEARESGVAGLLCGHTHEQSATADFDGLPLYLCGTSAQCRASAGNYVNVLTADVDKANGTCKVAMKPFVFDNAQGFIEA